MRIGVDIMGGDYAPDATLLGAALARKELPDDIELVLLYIDWRLWSGALKPILGKHRNVFRINPAVTSEVGLAAGVADGILPAYG